MKPAPLAALALAPVLLACGPRLLVETYEPPRLDIQDARTVVLTDGYGRVGALDVVARRVGREVLADGYFAFDDRVGSRERLEVAGRRAVLPDQPALADALYVRLDVLEWYAFDETVAEEVTDERGATHVVEREVTHAVALLSATVARSDGALLLEEVEYEGRWDGPAEEATWQEALDGAAGAAVDALLGELTPRRVRESIPLDESIEAHEPILRAAEQGQLDYAIAEMEAFVAENPGVAASRYNLAAFYDAAGHYEAALVRYGEAISLGGPSYYVRVRGECERRFERAVALGVR